MFWDTVLKICGFLFLGCALIGLLMFTYYEIEAWLFAVIRSEIAKERKDKKDE
jgi:hypothetical protein